MQRDGQAAVLYLPGEGGGLERGEHHRDPVLLVRGQVVAAAAANPGGSKLVSWLFPDPLGTATADVSACDSGGGPAVLRAVGGAAGDDDVRVWCGGVAGDAGVCRGDGGCYDGADESGCP